MKKAVTIKDIAEQLNLSRNTVAKALNGQYVPESTRNTVIKKAREMNYKGLNANPTEAESRKYRILLVSGKPLININYFIPLIKGIENYCFEKHYELFQYTFNKDRTPFSDFSEYVKSLKPNGVVAIECFNRAFIEKLINIGLPVVFNDFTVNDLAINRGYDIISADDERAVYSIVKMLHSKFNIKKFTFIGDAKHCRSFHERYMGMLKGIITIGAEHHKTDDILCGDESFDYGNPHAIQTEILKLKFKPECFICCNDFVARTVCKALENLGTRVPADALVVGFDNVSEAVSMYPEITSFSINKDFLGRETMRNLVSRIENPDCPTRMITIRTNCVQRASTDRYQNEANKCELITI
ncbi:MAG: LacI family transcriptional regulator [Clostridia bacterium]|nr:LacI family transcriptional regulator [Clostridia bacterium]